MPSSHPSPSYFQLNPEHSTPQHTLAIQTDEQQLTKIARRVQQLRRETTAQISNHGHERAGVLQQSLERDVQLHRLGQKLQYLDRVGPQACLGFMQDASTGERIYIGRLGLSDEQGESLLVDWRAPAAEPFFTATHSHPAGLAMRRRYRWRRQLVTDFWDEVFGDPQLAMSPALDDHSAFLASLGAERTGRMQDVLSSIQADQDAIIRSASAGALVVDGGPGTGKTVVALHRAAYLLYADASLRSRGGRVLVLSPHDSYTAYVSDILPNLGEDEVLVSTLSNLVSNVGEVEPESNPRITAIKSSMAMVDAVARAVKVFEQPPAGQVLIDCSWGEERISVAQWNTAVQTCDPGLGHNEAREQLFEILVEHLMSGVPDTAGSAELIRHELNHNTQLLGCLDEYWPVLDPQNLLRAVYSTPALLRYCAQGLSAAQIRELLDEPPATQWTQPDLPLLDLARSLVGDPLHAAENRRRAAVLASERELMLQVIADLITAADDKEDLSSQLMHADLQEQLVSQRAEAEEPTETTAEPFSHIIIDEAQDLSDAQWAMIFRRCPSGSLTIVGDRAQAIAGFSESWEERLARVGIRNPRIAHLNVNYRTTAQVMEAAAAVIHRHLPEANVPVSLRTDGAPVRWGRPGELDSIISCWLAGHPQGIAAVIGKEDYVPPARVVSLTPAQAKGLEFDLVVVYRPQRFGAGLSGAVQRYVAMTRATAQLVVLGE